MQHTKNSLKLLIAKDSLEETVEILLNQINLYLSIKQIDKQVDKINDALLINSGKLKGLIHDQNLGLLSSEEARITKAEVQKAILYVIDQLPESVFQIEKPSENFQEFSETEQSRLREGVKILKEGQTEFEFDVFLSFSSKDRDEARKIWEKLRGYGLRVFLSDEALKINVGSSFTDKIQYALTNSKHLILLATPNAMQSNYVKIETDAFFNQFFIKSKAGERLLIILRVNDFEISQLPIFYQTLQLAENVEQIVHSLLDKTIIQQKENEKKQMETEALMLKQKQEFEEMKQREREELERKALEEFDNKKQEELKKKEEEEKKRSEQEELEKKKKEEAERIKQIKIGEEKKKKEQEESEEKTLKKLEESKKAEVESIKIQVKRDISEHEKNRKMIPKYIFVIIGIAVFVIILLIYKFSGPGNQNRTDEQIQLNKDEAAFKEARMKGTKEAFMIYLRDFEQGKFRDEAQKALDNLNNTQPIGDEDDRAWDEARRINTKESYQKYLDEHDPGKHREQVRNALDELNNIDQPKNDDDRAWEDAKTGNTKEKLDKYLKTFPKGKHRIEAEKAIKLIKKPESYFVDERDGKRYNWVQIGKQKWMSQNLAYKPKEGNFWAYDNNENNAAKYGYLYDWETAKRICPPGWRLPSKADFETLLNNYGGGGKAAYMALIPGGSSGFSASFGGFREYNGGFSYVGKDANFWSSSTYYESTWYMYVINNADGADMDIYPKNCGMYVRCLQDN